MAYLNKVLLIGNLTKDPELRYLTSGTALSEFDIAINYKFKDKDKEEVTFLKIEVWGKTAEFCKEYLSKGRSVFIEGRIRVDAWDAKDGTKRKRYCVVADRVQFLDSKGAPPAGIQQPEEIVAEEGSDINNKPNSEKTEKGEPGVDNDLPF